MMVGVEVGRNLGSFNIPVEKIAFYPNPFPYPSSPKNLHALTLELIPGVNKFVDSQFDYISNIVKGFRGVLERLLDKHKTELANFVRNDVEKYIFVPETVKLKIRNFTEKSIRTYADNFEREIQSIQFSNGVRDVEKDLSDLCQVVDKFQCNRNIDCQNFIIGKGVRDVGVLVAGKLAVILLKGIYFPPLAAIVVAADYIWHLVKKEEGKEVLRQKTLEHLDEVLKAILEGNKDSIQAVLMEMENKIVEDTLAKYPQAQPVFQDLLQQRELLLSTSSFDKEIEVEYSVVTKPYSLYSHFYPPEAVSLSWDISSINCKMLWLASSVWIGIGIASSPVAS